MTPDITELFEFLYWQRDRALASAERLTTAAFLDEASTIYRDLRSTLVHELDVERSWRLRLQGTPTEVWDVTLGPGDYPDVASIADAWQQEEHDTLTWLSDVTDADLQGPVSVNGLEGFPLSTYLVHVVMHGVESLSAAATLLHRAGQSVGEVGYLDFIDSTMGRTSTG